MELRKRTGQEKESNGNNENQTREEKSPKPEKSLKPEKSVRRRSKPWKMPKKMKLLLEFLFVSIVSIGVIVLVVFPSVFKYSPFIRRQILFMNWVNFPIGKNLSNPETEFDLNCTRPLVIESTVSSSRDGSSVSEKIKLGLWHILPKSRISECDLDRSDRISDPFSDKRPIILYFHGNGGARGGAHRRGLYRVLAYNLDYHVITFDYRGYGDSEDIVPTLPGMVQDAKAVYDWLLRETNGDRDRILIWGHSLGTAIATYVVSSIQEGSKVTGSKDERLSGGRRQPPGVVLEAPFNSLEDVVTEHPFAVLYKHLPYFESFIVEPLLSTPDTSIDPQSKVHAIHSPVLILHAQDDAIIPYDLGYKLYHKFQLSRSTSPDSRIKFLPFPSHRGYGHKAIFKDPDLPQIIRAFVNDSLELRQRSRQSSQQKPSGQKSGLEKEQKNTVNEKVPTEKQQRKNP